MSKYQIHHLKTARDGYTAILDSLNRADEHYCSKGELNSDRLYAIDMLRLDMIDNILDIDNQLADLISAESLV